MTDNPQDLAYSRLFARYDEALERISVLSRENIALRQARLDALEEARAALDDLPDWADLTRCIVAIDALKEKQPE